MGRYCANCSNVINDGEMFCSKCGASTTGSATGQADQRRHYFTDPKPLHEETLRVSSGFSGALRKRIIIPCQLRRK